MLMAMIPVVVATCSCSKEERGTRVRETKFYASYNTNYTTKGENEFPQGNKAFVYCYNSGSLPTYSIPVAGTPKEAVAGVSGNLTTAGSVILPKGLYDFYAVSLNNTSTPEITFSSGLSQPLVNGKDYLWAKQSSVSEGSVVSFSFSHRAVGVELRINAGEGVDDINITSVKITPPLPGVNSVMDLQTGVIGMSTIKGSLTPVSLSGGKYFYIMLPAESLSMDVEVSLNAVIGGTAVTGRRYRATIPQQMYSGGILYAVNLTVNANTMSFNGSVIQDWTTQTIGDIILTED